MSAYSSVTWTAGDVLTEAKLDAMVSNDQSEDAHAANGLILNNNVALTFKNLAGSNDITIKETTGNVLATNASTIDLTGSTPNIKVGSANTKRTIILTGAGGSPTTTIGCGGPTKVEAGTNDIDYWALEFDTTTEERAFWNAPMPDNYDGSTVTARFIWTNASGSAAQTVRWGIKARSYADDEAIDQAYGSEVTVDDTYLAQGDVHVSAATSAITIGGTPAGGEYVVFNVGRKTASDDLTGDARLLGVIIEYGINAFSD